MDHANLLETLENVIPEDMLLRIAPAVSPTASPAADSLTSLRQSAAARFQNENVSGSDDEKPEPLAQSPSIDSTRSPPGEQLSSDTQRTSLRPGSAAPSTSSSSNSLHARGKRQSMFSGSSVRFEEKQKVEVLDGSNKSPSSGGPNIHSWNTASDSNYSRMATASNMMHATAPRSANGSRRKSTL